MNAPTSLQAHLDSLGIEQPIALNLAGLTRLTRAQVRGVPFENTTAILRRAATPDGPVPPVEPERLVQTWAAGRGGGVCFEIAAGFGRVLRDLGFAARQINAAIGWAGSHQAVLVEVEGTRYLVEVGNGAPMTEPIALDGPHEIRRAGLAYRFRPADQPERWIQDRWIDERWAPFCVYDLGEADPDVRAAAYQRHHTVGQSWVMDSLTLTRCDDDEVWSLRDDQLRHFTPDGKSVERILDPAAYAELAAGVFQAPNLPIERARGVLAGRAAANAAHQPSQG